MDDAMTTLSEVDALLTMMRIAAAVERIAESLELLEARQNILERPLTRGDADEVK
jgi:hypothetical protein